MLEPGLIFPLIPHYLLPRFRAEILITGIYRMFYEFCLKMTAPDMIRYAIFLLIPGLSNLCSAQCIDMKTDTVKIYNILCESSVSPATQYQLEVFAIGNSFYNASNFPFEALACDSLDLECDKALAMGSYRDLVPMETIKGIWELKKLHYGKMLLGYGSDDRILARLIGCLKQDVIFDRFFVSETRFTARYFVAVCRTEKAAWLPELCNDVINYNETLVISKINEIL